MSIAATIQKVRRYEQALAAVAEEMELDDDDDIQKLILINNAIINLLTELKKNNVSALNDILTELDDQYADDLTSFMYYLHIHLLQEWQLNTLTPLRSHNPDNPTYEAGKDTVNYILMVALILQWGKLTLSLILLNIPLSLIIIGILMGALVLINLCASCACGTGAMISTMSIAIAPFIIAIAAGLITTLLLPVVGCLLTLTVWKMAKMYINYLESYAVGMKLICDLHDVVITRSKTLFGNYVVANHELSSAEYSFSNADKLSLYHSNKQTLFATIRGACNNEAVVMASVLAVS